MKKESSLSIIILNHKYCVIGAEKVLVSSADIKEISKWLEENAAQVLL